MLRLAICDDDPKVVTQIRNIVDQYCKDTQITSAVEIYQDGSQVIQKASGSDIFFLDIEMPGMNGIQVAQELRANNKRAKIIFVTGYEEYQSAAFQLHAFSYLIKPFTPQDIKRQLEDAVEYLHHDQETHEIIFHTAEGDIRLSPEQITFIEYKNRKVEIHTAENKYIAAYTMKQVTELLEKYPFVSSHQNFLVNLKHVRRITCMNVTLINGVELPMSQKRSADFRKRYQQFLYSTFFVL